MTKKEFRAYHKLDQLVMMFDQNMRAMIGSDLRASRQNPSTNVEEQPLSSSEKRHAAGLMRVDHTGEICAQALYQGQALTARKTEVKEQLLKSAEEEIDHLNWCAERLIELKSHRSYLNPLWSMGSFAMGAIAGAMGDRWNLGFVAETERQVVKHIDEHLTALPKNDLKSRAILQQMREDEAHHATVALEAGASELPKPIQSAMKLMSKVMTKTTYWI